MDKKAQMGIKELGITLVMAAILFVIGLLIFSQVSNTTKTILDPTVVNVDNETISLNIMFVPVTENSTLLANQGVITSTIVARNGTGPIFDLLILDTDYGIATIGGGTGNLAATTNFTILDEEWNNTNIFVTYNYNTESESQASTAVVQTTVLDSFELGVIALIVLAAVVILSVLFMLGSR